MNASEHLHALETIRGLLTDMQRSGYSLRYMTLEDGEEVEFTIEQKADCCVRELLPLPTIPQEVWDAVKKAQDDAEKLPGLPVNQGLDSQS
jgi:hypothetical protein